MVKKFELLDLKSWNFRNGKSPIRSYIMMQRREDAVNALFRFGHWQVASIRNSQSINIFSAGAVRGTTISQNVIKDEADDIVINASVMANAQQNNLNGGGVGIANLGKGAVDATKNWWGCANGPNASGCSSVTGSKAQVSPWLSSPAVPNGSPNAQQ